MLRSFLLVSLLAVAVLALLGCRRASTSAADAASGPSVQRIVSLSPSTTESLFAMGAGGLVVGRSRFCNSPPEALKLPSVGGYTDPNYEAILGLAPTLVVGARGPAGPRLEERLRERGIATFFPETESVAQIETMLVDLGTRVNHLAEAKALVARAEERINGVEQAIAGKRRPKVLMLFDVEPVVAAGPASFPDELLRRAGGENVVHEGAPYPVLGIERVMVLDPDVIVDTTEAANHAKSRVRRDAPGWEKIRAVREGRVVVVSDESVLRPGPRIGDAVAAIATAIRPGLELPKVSGP